MSVIFFEPSNGPILDQLHTPRNYEEKCVGKHQGLVSSPPCIINTRHLNAPPSSFLEFCSIDCGSQVLTTTFYFQMGIKNFLPMLDDGPRIHTLMEKSHDYG